MEKVNDYLNSIYEEEPGQSPDHGHTMPKHKEDDTADVDPREV